MALRSGFNMPPGCFRTPFDADDAICDVCFKPELSCICPECQCGASGDPKCYAGGHSADHHGLRLTREQVISRAESAIDLQIEAISDAQRMLLDLQRYLEDLRDPSKPFEDTL